MYNEWNIIMRNCFAAFSLAVVVFGEPTSTAAAGPAVRIASTVRADAKSGRLVRKTLTPAQLRELIRVDELILEAASKHEVDPLLVRAVIEVESNYNPFAVSPKGAQGLMQLVGPTAERFGVKNSFVPADNIEAGVRYLKYLQGLFQDDQLALAAYNAGEGAVAKYNRVPPYRETQDYVERVGSRYRELRNEAGAGAEQALPEATGEPQHRPLEAFVDSEGRLHLRTR